MIADPPILEMRGVTKSYPSPHGDVAVLKGVDLVIPRGDFVAITGPSGSGKSTLLHLAALLDHPNDGEILLEGQSVTGLGGHELCQLRKTKIGMVFQQFHLLVHRSAHDNVMFRFRYTHVERAQAALQTRNALEKLGLGSMTDRKARLLSGGEMQRVAIARAIALQPSLLVADEPTGNLDKESALAVMDCFKKMNEVGITILFVTHNDHLLSYCSRHFVCEEGRLRRIS